MGRVLAISAIAIYFIQATPDDVAPLANVTEPFSDERSSPVHQARAHHFASGCPAVIRRAVNAFASCDCGGGFQRYAACLLAVQ